MLKVVVWWIANIIERFHLLICYIIWYVILFAARQMQATLSSELKGKCLGGMILYTIIQYFLWCGRLRPDKILFFYFSLQFILFLTFKVNGKPVPTKYCPTSLPTTLQPKSCTPESMLFFKELGSRIPRWGYNVYSLHNCKIVDDPIVMLQWPYFLLYHETILFLYYTIYYYIYRYSLLCTLYVILFIKK